MNDFLKQYAFMRGYMSKVALSEQLVASTAGQSAVEGLKDAAIGATLGGGAGAVGEYMKDAPEGEDNVDKIKRYLLSITKGGAVGGAIGGGVGAIRGAQKGYAEEAGRSGSFDTFKDGESNNVQTDPEF